MKVVEVLSLYFLNPVQNNTKYCVIKFNGRFSFKINPNFEFLSDPNKIFGLYFVLNLSHSNVH